MRRDGVRVQERIFVGRAGRQEGREEGEKRKELAASVPPFPSSPPQQARSRELVASKSSS